MNYEREQGSENEHYQNTNPEILVTLPAAQNCIVTTTQEVVVARLRPTWEGVVATYLSAAVDSPGTRRAYARHLKAAGDLFGVEYVDEVTGTDLTDFRQAIMEANLAPASQAQALSALRSFMGWAGSMEAHSMPSQVIKLALRTPRATVQVRYLVLNEREVGAILLAARAGSPLAPSRICSPRNRNGGNPPNIHRCLHGHQRKGNTPNEPSKSSLWDMHRRRSRGHARDRPGPRLRVGENRSIPRSRYQGWLPIPDSARGPRRALEGVN